MAVRQLAGSFARSIVIAVIAIGAITSAHADDEAIRSRIAQLTDRAERAGATELLDHASRALLESDRLRVSGDVRGAERAESIAETAVLAAERRVEAHRARTDREVARARLAELEVRARTAAEALDRARVVRARAAIPDSAPAIAREPTPVGE